MGVAANYTEEVPSKNWVEEENVHSIINGSAEGNKNGRKEGNKRTPYNLSYYASGNPKKIGAKPICKGCNRVIQYDVAWINNHFKKLKNKI
jgi:hypothetical protein